jgi:Ras-related C3 botulinum toxin substrate 1
MPFRLNTSPPCSTAVQFEDEQINLQLWDTAGHEDYKKLRSLSYPQTDVFVAVFSLICPRSLEHVRSMWVPEIQEHCPNTPFILVGTMSDLRDSFPYIADEYRSQGMERIPTSKGEEMMKAIGARAYVECSARWLYRLKEVFETAIKVVLHPPTRIAPDLMDYIVRGDVYGVQSALKRKKIRTASISLFF